MSLIGVGQLSTTGQCTTAQMQQWSDYPNGCPPGFPLTPAPTPANPCYGNCLNASGQNAYQAAQGSTQCKGIEAFPLASYLMVGGGVALLLMTDGLISFLGVPLALSGVAYGIFSNLGPQVDPTTGKVTCVAQGISL